MKTTDERKVVHSEETLRKEKRTGLQQPVDWDDGSLQNNLQSLHNSKHINRPLHYPPLTADINVQIRGDPPESPLMTMVAVGILLGHLLTIMTLIMCRCCKPNKESNMVKSDNAQSKNPKTREVHTATGSDLLLPSCSKSIQMGTNKVATATSTSKRNYPSSRTSLKSTFQNDRSTKEKHNQNSRISVTSAPPVLRRTPEKQNKSFSLSLKSAPQGFGSTPYNQTLTSYFSMKSAPPSPPLPSKSILEKKIQISKFSVRSSPPGLRSAYKQTQNSYSSIKSALQMDASHLSLKSAPPVLRSSQNQISSHSLKSTPLAIRSSLEKQKFSPYMEKSSYHKDRLSVNTMSQLCSMKSKYSEIGQVLINSTQSPSTSAQEETDRQMEVQSKRKPSKSAVTDKSPNNAAMDKTREPQSVPPHLAGIHQFRSY